MYGNLLFYRPNQPQKSQHTDKGYAQGRSKPSGTIYTDKVAPQ